MTDRNCQKFLLVILVSFASLSPSLVSGRSRDATAEVTEVKVVNVKDPVEEAEVTTEVVTTTNNAFTYCPKILLEPEVFVLLQNGSIYLPDEKVLLSPGHFSFYNRSHIFICSEFGKEETDKFSPIHSSLSLIGSSISIFCLILHLITFMILPEMRNMPGKNLASLSLTLLLGYTSFLLRHVKSITEDRTSCSVLGGIMYGSFLSSFLWTSVISFDAYRTMRLALSELKVCSGQQSTRYALYSIYAFLSAILASIVIAYIDANAIQIPLTFLSGKNVSSTGNPTLESIDLRPMFNEGFCWFGNRTSLLIFFVLPVGIILAINCVFFVLTSCIIVKMSANSSKLQSSQSMNERHGDFKLYLKLSLLMGLSWILGIISGLTDNSFLWILFILLNTFQGVFILWSFTCTSNNRKLLKKRTNIQVFH